MKWFENTAGSLSWWWVNLWTTFDIWTHGRLLLAGHLWWRRELVGRHTTKLSNFLAQLCCVSDCRRARCPDMERVNVLSCRSWLLQRGWSLLTYCSKAWGCFQSPILGYGRFPAVANSSQMPAWSSSQPTCRRWTSQFCCQWWRGEGDLPSSPCMTPGGALYDAATDDRHPPAYRVDHCRNPWSSCAYCQVAPMSPSSSPVSRVWPCRTPLRNGTRKSARSRRTSASNSQWVAEWWLWRLLSQRQLIFKVQLSRRLVRCCRVNVLLKRQWQDWNDWDRSEVTRFDGA